MIHKGQLLKSILEQNRIQVRKLANDMGNSRATIYQWIRNPDLPMKYFEWVGTAIGFDFGTVPEISEEIEAYRASAHLPKSEKTARKTRGEEMQITVTIDGTDASLEKALHKITVFNNAIKETL